MSSESHFPPERRAAAKRRCDQAAEGPWTHGLDLDRPDCGIDAAGGGCVCHVQCHGNVNTIARTGEEFSHDDARFIAAARTDLPDALAEIDRLEGELEQARVTNRSLHRRTQAAESDENDRTTPLRRELQCHQRSRGFACDYLARHGSNPEHCSELQRQIVRVVLEEKQAAETRAARLEAENDCLRVEIERLRSAPTAAEPVARVGVVRTTVVIAGPHCTNPACILTRGHVGPCLTQ